MYFLIEEENLLEKCNTICDKVSADIKKEFDNKEYNKEFLKSKIKSYGDEVTDFCDKEIKVDSNHTCLAWLNCILLSKKMKLIYTSLFKIV